MSNSKGNKPKENDGKVGENKNGNNNGHLDESTNRSEVDPFIRRILVPFTIVYTENIQFQI